MAQDAPDREQIDATIREEARSTVAQIMDAKPWQLGFLARRIPRPLDSVLGLAGFGVGQKPRAVRDQVGVQNRFGVFGALQAKSSHGRCVVVPARRRSGQPSSSPFVRLTVELLTATKSSILRASRIELG